MLLKQNQGIRAVVVFATVIVFTGVVYSFITVQQLAGKMLKTETRLARLEISLQHFADSYDSKLEHLSRKAAQLSAKKQPHSTVQSAEPENQTQIINYIKTQNKLITRLFKQQESLQEQFTLLKRQGIGYYDLARSSGSSGANGTHPESEAVQKQITIKDLEQEMNLADRQEQEIVQQIESTFQRQSQQGSWAAQTNVEIQNALESLRTDLNYTDVNINNIDCRETMCKIELSHGNTERLEEFDLTFLHQLTGETSMSTTFNTEILADGSVSRTYYLSNN